MAFVLGSMPLFQSTFTIHVSIVRKTKMNLYIIRKINETKSIMVSNEWVSLTLLYFRYDWVKYLYINTYAFRGFYCIKRGGIWSWVSLLALIARLPNFITYKVGNLFLFEMLLILTIRKKISVKGLSFKIFFLLFSLESWVVRENRLRCRSWPRRFAKLTYPWTYCAIERLFQQLCGP